MQHCRKCTAAQKLPRVNAHRAFPVQIKNHVRGVVGLYATVKHGVGFRVLSFEAACGGMIITVNVIN